MRILTPQKSLLFLILLTFFSCFPLLSQAADPPPCPEKEGMEETGFLLFKGPLVPCGVKTACTSSFGNIISTPCTICHLFILLKNLLDLMTSLLIIVSLFTITAGGVIYTVSAGNSQMVSLAKNLITKTLIGFGIFLLAWLIIYTVLKFVSFKFGAVNDGKWWTITCETKSLFVEDSSSFEEEAPSQIDKELNEAENKEKNKENEPAKPNPSTPEDETRVRDRLKSMGIEVNSPPCSGAQTTGCTNVGGLKESTIQELIILKNKCNCNLVVTGGSEGGHSSAHTNGYKVDLRSQTGGKDSSLTNYIEKDKAFGDPVGYRPGPFGGPIYKDGNNYYVKEKNHWDVCFNCSCAKPKNGNCQFPKPK